VIKLGMNSCWLCNSTNLIQISQKLVVENITSNDLKISDYQYGVSLIRYQCEACKFIFCPTATNTLDTYSEMTDLDYVSESNLRISRARKILAVVAPFASSGSWLDVGAGTGDLVQVGDEAGYKALGVEPSSHLVEIAASLGRNVIQRNLLDFNSEVFEVISFIDVIEHVENPKELLSKAVELLSEQGVLVLITPDVSSFMARFFKNSWWHIRPAHIGYFSQETLVGLLNQMNLGVISITKPPRSFQGSYLALRLGVYIPSIFRNLLEITLSRLILQLNLRDEILVIARKLSPAELR